jgi:acetyl esterase/lipase
MRPFRFLLVIALASVIIFNTSCEKEGGVLATITTPASLAADTMFNVPYGTDPLQKMDIYLPKGRSVSATKVMVLIHGGSWSAGDKTDMLPFIDSLKRRMKDYAFVNVNYRLAGAGGSNTFPTQENDIKAAVEYLNGKRTEYNISPKFVMAGVSAGAHLALLQAYKYPSPLKIKAVVDFFGPNDMTAMYNDPAPMAPAAGIAILLNGTPATNLPLYQYSSPIQFVTTTTPPTIILHGGADQMVKPVQATTLRDKLNLNGVANSYVFYPTEGHGWLGANLTDSFNKMQNFLNLYVQ